ncbi:MAG TPA: hypothetical protein VEY13_15340 [Rubrobacteraceae bacterium]|jgi:hypothetical protein|nr:hypothetical protein [Rubrobacteraceae bacterium]
MKKINVLVAMLALALFAAVPAFAQGYTITVGEGDVEITNTRTVTDSIVQSCEASVTFGDGNGNGQAFGNSQNADIEINGNENSLEFSQSASQSGFNPSAGTGCTQEIAQAAAAG